MFRNSRMLSFIHLGLEEGVRVSKFVRSQCPQGEEVDSESQTSSMEEVLCL